MAVWLRVLCVLEPVGLKFKSQYGQIWQCAAKIRHRFNMCIFLGYDTEMGPLTVPTSA